MRKLLALLALIPFLALAQSYTNFPNLQSGNVNFTATIRANGSACASGTAIVSGGGTVSCTAVVPTSQKGAVNGVASLDGSGKVPTSQLPFSGLTYDGSWNATTNSPTLADGAGTSGHFYITSVAGTQNLGSGSISFAVGDWALYNGTVWQKVPSSAAVTSVFGRTGAVAATAGDYTATQVTNTPAGGIAATTAQAAINELDTEKQPVASTLTSWAALTRASGFDTFTQTASSANLRGLLTDEVGAGSAYFVGGALGTPASATLTNGTGLPWSTGISSKPTTAAGFGITGGAKLDAYAGGDTPSAFTLGIIDSADAATWRSSIGAGTSSFNGDASTLTGTLADARLSSNVPLKNASNTFTQQQLISHATGLYVGDGSINSQFGYIPGSSSYIGTTSAHPFQIYTSGGLRAEVSAAGNVGIAAPSSGTTLTVNSTGGTAMAVDSVSAGLRYQLNASGARKGFFGVATATNDFVNGTVAGDLYIGPTAGKTVFTQNDGSGNSMVIGSAGNVTIAAPSSGGVTAQMSTTGSGTALRLTDGTVWLDGYVAAASSGYLGTSTAHALNLMTSGTSRMAIGSGGGVSIYAPSGGPALSVSGSVQADVGSATPGYLLGGYNMAQYTSSALQLGGFTASQWDTVELYTSATKRATLIAGLQLGAPTGGDKGAGTLNTAGTIYQNNVSVCLQNGTNCPSGSGVTSITGTSNQVIASASTGAVTLSLPQSIATGSSVQFGSFGVGTAASGVSGEIRATNNVTAYYSSDARLKKNIARIPNALAKVSLINGVSFEWTDKYISEHGGEDDYFLRRHDVGVIAQEVRNVLPEVVAEREDGTLAVKYDRLTALLIEAIKDLKAENDDLYERVRALEARR